MDVILYRHQSTDQGTLGFLSIPARRFLRPVMELPWRDNTPNMSSIPSGRYPCRRRVSPRFGETFLVERVPGRSHVLFHSGNFAGASDRGYRTHSHGCLLIGTYPGALLGQKAVLASKFAISDFMHEMAGVDRFELTIREAC